MQINFNYNKAISDANALDNYAKELEKIANQRLDGVINGLSSCWESESATLMKKKCLEQKESILEHASSLKKAATNLRNAAEQIRKAEEEVLKVEEALNSAGKLAISTLDQVPKGKSRNLGSNFNVANGDGGHFISSGAGNGGGGRGGGRF